MFDYFVFDKKVVSTWRIFGLAVYRKKLTACGCTEFLLRQFAAFL